VFLNALSLIQSSQPNQLLGLLPLVAMFAIFWFLVFMPMQRQKKQMKEMLESLQSGNVVQTTGGIIGTILSIDSKDDTLVLRIKPDNVKLQVARSAISGVISER
jgi:preprotein translocase subunit YajC